MAYGWIGEMNLEEYKPIPGFSRYGISKSGVVINIKTKKVLKTTSDGRAIALHNKGYKVTRTIDGLVKLTWSVNE